VNSRRLGGQATQREWIMLVVQGIASVYVDWAATEQQVRAAVVELSMPAGVLGVDVVATTDTFGCRIAVDLTGRFDEKSDGRRIARAYAAQLTEALGVQAFALHDLILAGRSEW
jgi:hypothetical protein